MSLKKLTLMTMVTLIGVSLCTIHSKADDNDDDATGVVQISDGSQINSDGGQNSYPSPFDEWAAPSRYPVHPGFFYYRRYYPDYWAGQPQPVRRKTAKMIFTPTDTTQLGYYYQHVPVWQPNPSMIPPEPHPATWHNWDKLPANVVWTRRGMGEPIGVAAPQQHPFMQRVYAQGNPAGRVNSSAPVSKPDSKPPVPIPTIPEAK